MSIALITTDHALKQQVSCILYQDDAQAKSKRGEFWVKGNCQPPKSPQHFRSAGSFKKTFLIHFHISGKCWKKTLKQKTCLFFSEKKTRVFSPPKLNRLNTPKKMGWLVSSDDPFLLGASSRGYQLQLLRAQSRVLNLDGWPGITPALTKHHDWNVSSFWNIWSSGFEICYLSKSVQNTWIGFLDAWKK